MEWQDEKKALVATIQRQEQEADALARRFKLLQQTLKEQQKLLDRYQRALSAAKADSVKFPEATAAAPKMDKRSTKTSTKSCETTTGIVNSSASADRRWMKKKTTGSSDLGTLPEAPVPVPVKTDAKVKKKTAETCVFKPTVKRRSDALAATWAEEKRRLLKKPKWEQTLELSASGSNKENVWTEQTTDKPKRFAYVEVVRNREERKTLPGHDCIECKKYYDALGGLGAGDATAHKNKCSRHRARFEPYQTPDDFWRLSFPDSEPR